MSGLWLVDRGNACLQWGPFVKEFMEGQKWPQPLLYDAQFVMERIYLGEWQLWLSLDSENKPNLMMVTYVQRFPAGKVCFIEMACGENIIGLFKNQPAFDNWCKSEGISLAQAVTRPEIAAYGSRHGWHTGGNVSMYKFLEGMH